MLALTASAAIPAASGAQSTRHPWTVPHVLRYATAEDVVSLNPHLNAQATLSYMSSLTMAWLVRYDGRNRPVPELATAVPTRANGGVSPDGKTIVYHLRRDARWSDGAPFTAADVRFSVDVVRDKANNETSQQGFDQIDRVETPDPYTVVFRLRRPHASFVVDFFGSAYGRPCILPAHLFGGKTAINEAAYNALPVGIGPFKYAVWKRGDRIEMVPDPLYFGRKPKLREVVFDIVPDRNTLLMRMAAHELDLWFPVPAAYADRVGAIAGVRTLRLPSYAYNHLDFELQHGPLRDPVVRRALRLALDRRAIVAKVGHGYGVLEETILPPGHPFHVGAPLVPFDLAAANRLLDADGWRAGADGVRTKDGERLAFTFVSPTGAPDTDAMLEMIRQTWGQIGVQFTVRRYPTTLLFAPANAGGVILGGKFDLVIFGWTVSPLGDLANLFSCASASPAGMNVVHYCDPQVDRALKRFDETYDEASRRAASRFIQQRLAQDVPTIVLNAREDVFAYNDDLHGFQPNHVTPFDDLVDADI
ncbi:MAG TPA: peptide ABC transporter substrate-binding protein [Candidatus Limnocylindria bacterium]|nr:peptide ABC transporter substrate-binding protein [Candidatus Limnocylindria bacterium]